MVEFTNDKCISYHFTEFIFNDVKDEDLKWVTEKIHYYLLRLLEEVDYEKEDEVELVSLMD